jgi:putative ABC transport system substrate-binding protein
MTLRRRDFITLLGGAAAWPLAARAQQAAPAPVAGFLYSGAPETFAPRLAAFRQGLSETGFIEGRNITIEYRWARNEVDRLPELATDLVARRVAVIAAPSIGAALAAKAATAQIPIVFGTGADPIKSGLVASLNRPGGNATGVTSLIAELGPKRLQLLHELVPTARVLAIFVNPTNRNAENQTHELRTAAATLGLELHTIHISSEPDFDAGFATAGRLRAGGLLISADQLFNSWAEQLAVLAVRHAIPAIYNVREFAALGGLMSYGPSILDEYRQVGLYTGRILKGEKPADLPVQQATKVELIINLKTAKALGLTVPPTLFALANEVIE